MMHHVEHWDIVVGVLPRPPEVVHVVVVLRHVERWHVMGVVLPHDTEAKHFPMALRAERKAGELLAEREKVNGARGTGSNQHRKVGSDSPTPPNLADLGISKQQSSDWQRLA